MTDALPERDRRWRRTGVASGRDGWSEGERSCKAPDHKAFYKNQGVPRGENLVEPRRLELLTPCMPGRGSEGLTGRFQLHSHGLIRSR